MISYITGAYDILREKDLKELDKQIQISKSQNVKNFAIGVYDNNLCTHLGLNTPLKSLEDRLQIMSQIRGVDFTFPVSSLDPNVMKKRIEKAYQEYSNKIQSKHKHNNNPRYALSYAPGTYDLFHAGHLENLLIASENSEKLIVGVKADELVREHKNRDPIISAEERAEILRHFKFVYDVYIYYTRDLINARDFLKSKYNQDIDAVFLGSDLKNDFKDVEGINIVFTDRDEEKMAERSTTAYVRKIALNKEHKKESFTGNLPKKSNNKDKSNESEGLEI